MFILHANSHASLYTAIINMFETRRHNPIFVSSSGDFQKAHSLWNWLAIYSCLPSFVSTFSIQDNLPHRITFQMRKTHTHTHTAFIIAFLTILEKYLIMWGKLHDNKVTWKKKASRNSMCNTILIFNKTRERRKTLYQDVKNAFVGAITYFFLNFGCLCIYFQFSFYYILLL